MAIAPQTSLHMRSADLIRKEPLDFGGFGEVYLCYHATLGHVVLKTLYTGPLRSEESKRSLLEEGSIMASLDHERVVKLLGVIMEDKDCSLVLELLPRGNLLAMLETVKVPVSIKGRIILEILEGMVYLTERKVVHKDIKPENILVDKNFHIKIADLGLATCQMWSKLTREEYRRRSRSQSGQSAVLRGAGTLSYMAPEHLESIHTLSTEKSDVYSFAIVVWVILTGEEPYANARSEDQISQCVRNGDRPAEDIIPEDTPPEMIALMRRCWSRNPEERPTFKEAYNSFHSFYMEKLNPLVEEDLRDLRKKYEGPSELVEKMKSMSITSYPLKNERDSPAPLVSSETNVAVPVEASVEDLSVISNKPYDGLIEVDAMQLNGQAELREKLDRELHYHKHGSYCEIQPEPVSSPYDSSSNAAFSVDQPVYLPSASSSVHSWTKPPVQTTSKDEIPQYPASVHYGSMTSPSPTPTHLTGSSSTSSLPQYNQHLHTHLNRQQSWPVYPAPETLAPDLNASKGVPVPDQGSLYIHNASGIQIGNNNILSFSGHETLSASVSGNNAGASPIQQGLLKYGKCPVTDEHLDLLRENIGSNWKTCARRLGLTNVEIDTIAHDYCRDGLPEMVHQMLERWKMKEGSIGCSVGNLCTSLKGCLDAHVIRKILDMCGS